MRVTSLEKFDDPTNISVVNIYREGEDTTMKIAVSATGNHLDSAIDPRFGRCAYFLIVDTENMNFEAFSNESSALGGGAGIQSGQLMAERQVKAVVTGNIGPNAFQTLQSAGVEIITGASGSIKEAIENYKKGALNPTQEPTRGLHGMMK